MSPRGRRPGDTSTRSEILEAARERFSAEGYRGATIRGIARTAEVDPALIHHYFGTKRELFRSALDLPIDEQVVRRMIDGPRSTIGRRVVSTYLSVWDGEATRDRLRGLLRSAAVDDHAARMLREFVVATVLGPIVNHLEVDEPEVRVTLVGSHLVGIAMARYVLLIEPLASLEPERIVELVAPTIQRYLTGPLPSGG